MLIGGFYFGILSNMKPAKRAKRWRVYIIKCLNGSLYTGATNDLERRLRAHAAGRGARYTRAFGVAKLVYSENCGSRSSALKREAAIKKLTRKEKCELVKRGTERTGINKKPGKR